MGPDEKLKVLVCGGDDPEDRALFELLKSRSEVGPMTRVSSIGMARPYAAGDVTTIFIDPLALGLSEASDFVLGIRRSRPEVAFVLFLEADRAKADADSLYRGVRELFREFPVLDKTAPMGDLAAALDPVLRRLRGDLLQARTRAEAGEVVNRAREIAASVPGRQAGDLVEELETVVEKVVSRVAGPAPVRPKRVFLSYRFEENDYADGLKELLHDHGFEVVTGEEANRSISSAVLDRIRTSDFFLCLLTRVGQMSTGEWTTSSWVIEEKGAALAMEKYIVLLVEDGVTGIGGLQGDWQQHRFTPKEFTTAALRAVRELRIAAGREPDVNPSPGPLN